MEEYIELFNKGAGQVSLTGWKFTGGVSFTFSNASIPAGGYLVVAANLAAFSNKYPGVTNVVGGWLGFLNNDSEGINLDDACGATGRMAFSMRTRATGPSGSAG